jgi:hypothetical protein
MDGCVRIERATNGYTVNVSDPKIREANQKRDNSKGGVYAPYRDPNKEYIFTDIKTVLAFLEKNLDKALPKDDYGSSFDAAIAADAGDD